MTPRRPLASTRVFLACLGMALVLVASSLGGIQVLRDLFPTPLPPPEPEEVNVAFVDDASKFEQIELPELEALAQPPEPEPVEEEKRETEEEKKKRELAKPEPKREKLEPPKPKPAPPPPQAKPEPPKPQPPPVAKVQPPKPVAPPPPPPPPQPEAKKPKPKLPPKIDRKKMVEVDDEKNVVNETNYEAEYWSDKNRRVKEQTRDTDTNLEKATKGKGVASAESRDRDSPEIGGPEDKVRQNEDAEATSLDANKRDNKPTAHNGDAEKAKGVRVGVDGEGGEGGKNGGGEGAKPGALSMRDVEGRGAPGSVGFSVKPAPTGADDDAPVVSMSRDPGNPGRGGKPGPDGKSGKPGRRGPRLNLEQQDYARIVGEDKVKEEEREVARRQKSHKKGRWEKKLEGIRSSLENFTPEVRPGNQTALGTRAHPFALYIARMHRGIHEVWGYGFLEDLDSKPISNPMNDRTLAVTMEIAINPDGSVEKVTIVKPSGVLTFDVAAIDTVMSSGPYEETPEDIRSADGKVYMHWTFHRDERMCTPYFADPFILDNPKGDHDHGAERGLPDPGEEIARRKRESPERLRREKGSATDGDVEVPRVTKEELDKAKEAAGVAEGQEGDAARANANVATPDDPAAEGAALSFANAFEKGDVNSLVAASGTPFKSAGTTVAADQAGLANVWKNVLEEMPKRNISEWKIFSAAGYRVVFGHLPKGGEDGTARLYLVIKTGGERLTLDLVQDGNGIYRVVGLTR